MKDKPATAIWILENDPIYIEDRLASLRFRLLGTPCDVYISGNADLNLDICFNAIYKLVQRGQYRHVLVSQSDEFKSNKEAQMCLHMLSCVTAVRNCSKPSKLYKVWKWLESVIAVVTHTKQ